MSGQIFSNSGNNVHINKRPRRIPAPTTKLLDKNNLKRAALPFQQRSIDNYWAAHEVEDSATSNLENPNTTSLATSPTLSQIPDAASSPPPFGHAKGKRRIFEVDTPDDSDSAPDGARSTVHPQAKKGMWFCIWLPIRPWLMNSHSKVARNSATLGNPDAVDADGYLADINV
jgi:hypothetical protein